MRRIVRSARRRLLPDQLIHCLARLSETLPAGELRVWALLGDPATQLVLLRRLVDFDLIGTVKIRAAGVDVPLPLWVGGPTATSDLATYDSLWVRVVDLPEALQDRTWSAPCDVVIEVADTMAPWNDGSWRIRADGAGEATVERTTAESDVRLRVDAPGEAYLGGGNLAALQRAGLVTERRKGAVGELWRAMRTEISPTAAVGFRRTRQCLDEIARRCWWCARSSSPPGQLMPPRTAMSLEPGGG